ncbi:MAG: hypothetical protein JSU63_08045 [Phycisphaerales bacterium]|nr:MAG: hypothetical protein JSU63_08045 [Phycisphaerales bacterium]
MLECVARAPKASRYGSYTVEALFHIGAADADVQERLLRIVSDPQTRQDARAKACYLLGLGADEGIQKALLERVKSHEAIEDTLAEQAALMDLGNEEFIRVFAQKVSALPDENVMKPRYQRYVRFMRAAQNLPELLELLSSSENIGGRGWLVLQAARRGATREQIRQAVLDYLMLPKELTVNHDKSGLLGGVAKLGILTEEDIQEFPKLGRVLFAEHSGMGSLVEWATRPKERWGQVHRLKELRNENYDMSD